MRNFNIDQAAKALNYANGYLHHTNPNADPETVAEALYYVEGYLAYAAKNADEYFNIDLVAKELRDYANKL